MWHELHGEVEDAPRPPRRDGSAGFIRNAAFDPNYRPPAPAASCPTRGTRPPPLRRPLKF